MSFTRGLEGFVANMLDQVSVPDVSIEGVEETLLCIVHMENGLLHRKLTCLHFTFPIRRVYLDK